MPHVALLDHALSPVCTFTPTSSLTHSSCCTSFYKRLPQRRRGPERHAVAVFLCGLFLFTEWSAYIHRRRSYTHVCIFHH